MVLWHIVGWLTVASQVVLGVGTAWYLCTHHKVPLTWERRLPAPRVLDTVPLSPGSDFVGYV